MIIKTLIILLFITLVYSTYRIETVRDPQAVCIDGSMAKFYYKQGDPNKIFIHFQRGGGCLGPSATLAYDQCVTRRSNEFGSSNYFNPNFDFASGIMSTTNDMSMFKDWTKAFFPYCDGTLHQGYKSAPIVHNGQNIYIRGDRNTKARLAALQALTGLFSNSTHIVVSGTSAGGIAVYSWINYIKDNVNPNSQVWGVIDSATWKDRKGIHNLNVGRIIVQVMMSFSNAQIDPPNTLCVNNNPTQKFKCFFAEYVPDYLKVPVILISSQYDDWFLPNLMGVKCIGQNGTLLNCNNAQRAFMEEYRNDIIGIMQKYQTYPGNAVWSIACTAHGLMNSSAKFGPHGAYNIPKNSFNSGIYTLQKWMSGSYDFNNPLIDNISWPYNIHCAFKQNLRIIIICTFILISLIY